MAEVLKKHLIIKPEYFSDLKAYSYAGGHPKNKPVPAQDRTIHSQELNTQLLTLKQDMAAAIAIQKESQMAMDYGISVEFESFDGISDIFETTSIVRKSELLNTRIDDNKTFATVFIPDGALSELENKIQDYINYRKKINGHAFDNQPLIDTIKSLKKATVKALWTDTIPIPSIDNEVIIWEVWLSVRNDREKQRMSFIQNAKNIGIEISESYINFRERTVLLVRASKNQLEQSIDLLNNIAELRKAKTTADFFIDLPRYEQKEWINDLFSRLRFSNDYENNPYICILDTGVNSAHPLLQQSISEDDLFTVNEAWGKNDNVGHGTNISGLALFGDLTYLLESNKQIEINHRLESSKIINKSESYSDAEQPLDLYAEHTQQAMLRAEIANAKRKRIFQLAVTTIDARDRGRPSSWSAALDMMAFGSDNKGNTRLIVVSAGNANISRLNSKYPDLNKEEGIRDPAQSWNALAIGAFTEKDLLSSNERIDDNEPTAAHGELSPYSTTSFHWDKKWPYKPDIVMEGGNTAVNKYGQVQADSLSLLTTHHKINEKFFSPMYATSAASALASKMCAQIMSVYSGLRPETIRALLIHCAQWTPAMLKQFNCDLTDKKGDYVNLVRICGFGVPNTTRAIESLKNDYTMVIEDMIYPYKREKNKTAQNKDMKFYYLPFPQKGLENLGSTKVEMRITLSYFIEPNPSSRVRSVYSYKSHGLRFDIKNPTEKNEIFMGRINKAMQEEEINYENDEADRWWTIGVKGRTKGSIHYDIWHGTASELAACNLLAVFPVYGWWKNHNDTVNNAAHYSLLVSIKVSTDTDLMTETENIIANKVKTTIPIEIL